MRFQPKQVAFEPKTCHGLFKVQIGWPPVVTSTNPTTRIPGLKWVVFFFTYQPKWDSIGFDPQPMFNRKKCLVRKTPLPRQKNNACSAGMCWCGACFLMSQAVKGSRSQDTPITLFTLNWTQNNMFRAGHLATSWQLRDTNLEVSRSEFAVVQATSGGQPLTLSPPNFGKQSFHLDKTTWNNYPSPTSATAPKPEK